MAYETPCKPATARVAPSRGGSDCLNCVSNLMLDIYHFMYGGVDIRMYIEETRLLERDVDIGIQKVLAAIERKKARRAASQMKKAGLAPSKAAVESLLALGKSS